MNPVSSELSYLDTLKKQAGGATEESSATSIQNRFLTMLVTELKNQDPLNPMDSKDMTTQLAQISTVQGIEKVNAELGGLSQQLFASRILGSINLIGKTVGYSAKNFKYDGKHSISGDVSAPTNSGALTITITDGSGKVIRTIRIDHPDRQNHISWDGKNDAGETVPPGNYSVKASVGVDGKEIETAFMMKRTVTGISQDKEGIILLFDNGEGIHLGDVDSFEEAAKKDSIQKNHLL